jgi:hypothetical protein
MLPEQSRRDSSAHIPARETPKIKTNSPDTKYHEEAHREHEADVNEANAEASRLEILGHYDINPEQAISLPTAKGKKREIRAFTILQSTESPSMTYYADGHTAHAILLDAIFKKFPQTGVKSREELTDDFFNTWNIKKGFIDPQREGFKSFDNIHTALTGIVAQHKDENGLSKKDAEAIQNGERELPNWFRSG